MVIVHCQAFSVSENPAHSWLTGPGGSHAGTLVIVTKLPMSRSAAAANGPSEMARRVRSRVISGYRYSSTVPRMSSHAANSLSWVSANRFGAAWYWYRPTPFGGSWTDSGPVAWTASKLVPPP